MKPPVDPPTHMRIMADGIRYSRDLNDLVIVELARTPHLSFAAATRRLGGRIKQRKTLP
jgi:hypothetical protein